MQYAIELFFDEETEKKLFRYAERIAEESFYKACDLVLREFEKINGKFASIGLIKTSFPVKEIFVAELK